MSNRLRTCWWTEGQGNGKRGRLSTWQLGVGSPEEGVPPAEDSWGKE